MKHITNEDFTTIVPTVPTAVVGTNTTQAASTAYVIAERSNTSTLANKTLTTPVIAVITNTGTLTLPIVTSNITSYIDTTITSSATPTPTGNARENNLDITAQAVAATFAAPTGTAANKNSLMISIKDNGTAQTLGYNAIFIGGTDLALPLITIAGKWMHLQFTYNSTAVKWHFIGYSKGY